MWDVPTIHKFMRISKDHRFADIYHLGLLTGMRRGELAGLKWEYVDLDKAQLSVANTLQRIVGYGLVEGRSKTPLSRRMIALRGCVRRYIRSV